MLYVQLVYMHGIAVKALFLVRLNGCNHDITLKMTPYDSERNHDIFSDAHIYFLDRR